MVNKYVWDLYLQSGGYKTVTFFEDNLSRMMSASYPEEIARLQGYYCVTRSVVDDVKEQLSLLQKDFDGVTLVVGDDDLVIEQDFFNIIDDIIAAELEDGFEDSRSEKLLFESFISWMEVFTTELAIQYAGIFIPYYFKTNYNVLTLIADAFSIQLPALPKKADYKARIWHYVELCKVFYHFRMDNQLSFYELCAFLYDFGPRYIGGIDSYIIRDLPVPKAAFFVGGGGDNSDAVAEDNPKMVSFWQCSPETMAGDIVVMYLRSPISAISSVWRSLSVGFIDPFFYYYRCTFIGNPVKIPRISLREVKTDPVLATMPIVAKNMQGINGVELKPSEYNYIVKKSEVTLPILEYVVPERASQLPNEKAVEEELIKPLLKRLGYTEADYVQQMYIEIGNHNHALIPDFVLHPVSSGGHYSGFAIIEAKRSITNEKQLSEVKKQARSYAKLLGTKYAVIASMEKVWISSAKDDYARTIYEQSWKNLADEDTLFELVKMIGNRSS